MNEPRGGDHKVSELKASPRLVRDHFREYLCEPNMRAQETSRSLSNIELLIWNLLEVIIMQSFDKYKTRVP